MFNFVLVHRGPVFIPYIIDAIRQIRKFNDGCIYLAISPEHFNQLRGMDVELINIDTLPKSDKHLFFIEHSRLNRKYRGGFWFYAMERFFCLEDVMLDCGLQDVVHLENDTLIYFNVDGYQEVFRGHYDMAAVFDNDVRCIPCFFYIKQIENISSMTQYIIDSGGKKTDMEIVPLFRNDVGIVDNLPVIPADYDAPLVSATGKTTTDGVQYSRNVDLFDAIFDGAAIGQYLGGVDPRNKKSNIVGFVNESALFDVSKFNVFWDRVSGLRVPYMKHCDREYRINNLHIHSKRLNEFTS